MNKLFFSLSIIFVLALPFTSHANSTEHTVDSYPFTSSEKSERFQLLLQEIRCLVCQNQNIADSNAPLALDLRKKIYHMMRENKSNQEIKQYLVSRYGEFILLKPRFMQSTFILWVFPLAGITLILLTLIYHSKRQQS